MKYLENKLKYERVKGELGSDASEEAIVARYVELGGRVIEVADPVVVEEKPVAKKKRK